jgi:hypothetical protein
VKKTQNEKKNLALRTETVRPMSAAEMSNIAGGYHTICWTIVIPSSGITTITCA